MAKKYPGFVKAECKWCGNTFNLWALNKEWKRRHNYCCDLHQNLCKKAWKRGGSQIEGPLIGKINFNTPPAPRPGFMARMKDNSKKFDKERKIEKANRKKALAALDAEYWAALRRSKGLDVQLPADTNG